jgi:arsenate reductase (thioredoxin)
MLSVTEVKSMDKIPKVLFLSKGNASRAHIAEGFLRHLAGNRFVPFSAGTESADVNPLAMEVMSEAGVDISTQRSREVASLFRETFHYVVVLCDHPRERYPLYPFTRTLLKWSVPNPEVGNGGPDTRKHAFRQVRDQMRNRVEALVQTINQPGLANVRAAA